MDVPCLDTFEGRFCYPGAGLCHFCQPQINTVSQNCGQQQPSVFWPDVIILVSNLRNQTQTAMVFVTHDLRLARLIADRAIVMDQGRIVSESIMDRLLTEPEHLIAQALVKAMI